MIVTGLEKSTVCQPEALSLVNMAEASSVPLVLHRLPTWVPVFVDAL